MDIHEYQAKEILAKFDVSIVKKFKRIKGDVGAKFMEIGRAHV